VALPDLWQRLSAGRPSGLDWGVRPPHRRQLATGVGRSRRTGWRTGQRAPDCTERLVGCRVSDLL